MNQIATRFLAGARAPMTVFALMCADIITIIGAMVIALLLRYYDGNGVAHIFQQYLEPHVFSLPFVLAFYLVIFAAFRLYRYAWRFASIETVWSVVYANSVGLVGLTFLQNILDEGGAFPRAMLIIFWLVSIFLIGGVRIVLRFANISRNYGHRAMWILRKDVNPVRVVILGGGTDGARLVTALQEDINTPYDVIGLLDDTPHKQGVYIRGARVIGPLSHLYELLAKNAVDEVLIAMPSAGGADIREYVLACRRKQVPVKVIPGLREVLNGKARVRLEEISVEDLLRRPPVRIDIGEIGGYLTGKRILVTGAGGSIGSELCRQISALDPAELVLLGHGENSIHLIYQELVNTHPAIADRLHIVIASIADDVRIDQVFNRHRPEVVFHAAAHKHVPIMELNVPEAVQNNVLGTYNVATACGRYGVERVVTISTDKAVDPSSVMGATKWLCEEVLRAVARMYPATTCVIVRFGNVLGSRGSVVTIFREQIKRGGPVTVTHPEMTRYFMIIPEAVQLVLQAAAVGKSGDLFLLDMGQPVKILDLARDMIRLSGLEPDVDIPIVFTGLRAGEKLTERLATAEEHIEAASREGLLILQRPQRFTPEEMQANVLRLRQLIRAGDSREVLVLLSQIVPSFTPQVPPADSEPTNESFTLGALS